MTRFISEGFEDGTDGIDITSGNTTATAFSGTRPTFSSTEVADGNLSALIDTDNTSSINTFGGIGTVEHGWIVFKVWLVDLPDTLAYLTTTFSGSDKCADMRINPTGTLTVRDNNAAVITSTVALTTEEWHRIAFRVIPGDTLGLKIYLGDGDTLDYSSTASSTRPGTLTDVRFGAIGSSTITYYLDSIEADDEEEPGAPTPDPTFLYYDDGTEWIPVNLEA